MGLEVLISGLIKEGNCSSIKWHFKTTKNKKRNYTGDTAPSSGFDRTNITTVCGSHKNQCLVSQSGTENVTTREQAQEIPFESFIQTTRKRRRTDASCSARRQPPSRRDRERCAGYKHLRVYASLFVVMHVLCLPVVPSVYLSARSHVWWDCIVNTWASGSAPQCIPQASKR